MHPVQHRDILVMHATRSPLYGILHRILYAFHNPASLFASVLRMVKYRRLATRPHRLQDLFNSILVVLDDRIRHLQNARSRAVIVLQQNRLCTLMELVKFQNAVDIGATPTVNGLIRITYHKQILVITRKQIRQAVLLSVNILVLIDHHIHHAFAPLVEFFRKILENVERDQNQVIEVQGVIFLLFIKIAVINSHPLVRRIVRQFHQMLALFTFNSRLTFIRQMFCKQRNITDIICLAATDKIKDTADFQILERESQIRICLAQK